MKAEEKMALSQPIYNLRVHLISVTFSSLKLDFCMPD